MAAVSELMPRAERLASLRERAREMEEALKEEGFEEEGPHAVFVRWQRQSMEELGSLLLDAEETFGKRVEAVCSRLEESKAVGDIELGRLRIMFAGGDKAIALGRQAAETAIAAGQRADQEFERSVSQIATDLSSRLVESSQQWLVLRQTSRNRRDAWILAVIVSIVAVGVFVGGYVARAYQDDVALSGFYEMQARIADCQRDPVRVKDAHVDGIRPACWLDQVLAKRGGG